MRALLADGTAVAIREIRASDKALLAAGFGRLSEASRERRFLTAKPRLTGTDLRYLTEVDGIDHYAIVAVMADRWDGEIAAVARFVRLPEDPSTAEAAIVVGDCHQGKGLGRQMALQIAAAARRRGIRRIQASIRSDNPPAHRLMEIIGERLTDGGHDHGVHELTAELAA
jgi:RimJ/RimL family protein N-acetyltransferase